MNVRLLDSRELPLCLHILLPVLSDLSHAVRYLDLILCFELRGETLYFYLHELEILLDISELELDVRES